ncbi:MAG: hypothetical protein ACRDPT_11765 [Streptomycetales bacterium]
MPRIYAFALTGDGTYTETGLARPGQDLTLTRPFPVTLAAGMLAGPRP